MPSTLFTPARREFLMQPSKYSPQRDAVAGYFVSEKLEGVRAFWDGGLSRGRLTTSIPYASKLNPRTRELKKRLRPVATGLWTADAMPITAPEGFLNQLPCMPLDGTLWAGRGTAKRVKALCLREQPDKSWEDIEYAVFGSPPLNKVFQDGLVINSSTLLTLNEHKIQDWFDRLDAGVLEDYLYFDTNEEHMPFEREMALLRNLLPADGNVYLAGHRKLPINIGTATAALVEIYMKTITSGGAGLLLRQPESIWEPCRTRSFLTY